MMELNPLRDHPADLTRGTRPPPADVEAELAAARQLVEVQRLQLELQSRALEEVRQQLALCIESHSDFHDSLPVGCLLVATDGIISRANRTAAEWLQRPQAELAGASLGEFLDPADAPRLLAQLAACAQLGGEAQLDLSWHVPGGVVLDIRLGIRCGPPVSGGGRLLYVVATNISQLKHAQQVLDDVNGEQEALHESISHDLRSPLVTISNYAQVVLQEHGPALGDEVRSMIERIERAALRLETTLQQLLEFNRLGRAEFSLGRVELDALVADVLAAHRARIEERHAVVTVVRPLGSVRASALVLTQIVTHLLNNALKYTQPHQPPQVTISARDAGTHVEFCMADRGIGIAPKHHARVFRLFERLHAYAVYPGSGIGLAIVRRAVERMHGRVWLESEPGAGCSVFVQLPRA